jgi:hypothetical protein
MAAGDVSKKLMNEIRDTLGDNARILVKSDFEIYNYLTEYQQEFMERYLTTSRNENITMVADTLNYNLDTVTRGDDVASEFIDIYKLTSDDDDSEAFGKFDHINYRIVMEEDSFTAGEVITVRGHIKPLETTIITDSYDPIIGWSYYPYLKRAVLTNYSIEGKNFGRITWVRREVERKAADEKSKIRYYHKKNPLNRTLF